MTVALLSSLLPVLLSLLLLTLAAGNPTIWMTSLISVEEEKPSTIAPSGKSVTEDGSSVTTVLLTVSIGDVEDVTGWIVVVSTSASVELGRGAKVVVVVVLAWVVVVVVVVVAAVVLVAKTGLLALRPLFDLILSPICCAWIDGALLVSSGRLANGVVVRFLIPGLSINQHMKSK